MQNPGSPADKGAPVPGIPRLGNGRVVQPVFKFIRADLENIAFFLDIHGPVRGHFEEFGYQRSDALHFVQQLEDRPEGKRPQTADRNGKFILKKRHFRVDAIGNVILRPGTGRHQRKAQP